MQGHPLHRARVQSTWILLPTRCFPPPTPHPHPTPHTHISSTPLQVLHADLAHMGGIKALPYLLMFAASNAGGWAGDWVINVRRRSVAAGRKLVNTAGFWSAAVALMLMAGARGACCRCCCVRWGA